MSDIYAVYGEVRESAETVEVVLKDKTTRNMFPLKDTDTSYHVLFDDFLKHGCMIFNSFQLRLKDKVISTVECFPCTPDGIVGPKGESKTTAKFRLTNQDIEAIIGYVPSTKVNASIGVDILFASETFVTEYEFNVYSNDEKLRNDLLKHARDLKLYAGAMSGKRKDLERLIFSVDNAVDLKKFQCRDTKTIGDLVSHSWPITEEKLIEAGVSDKLTLVLPCPEGPKFNIRSNYTVDFGPFDLAVDKTSIGVRSGYLLGSKEKDKLLCFSLDCKQPLALDVSKQNAFVKAFFETVNENLYLSHLQILLEDK